MRRSRIGLACLAVAWLSTGAVLAWHIEGKVYCDVNQSGTIDAGDSVIDGARVLAMFAGTNTQATEDGTDAQGFYYLNLPDYAATYRLTLDPNYLPPDATIVQPPMGEYIVDITDTTTWTSRDWLIDSATCREATPGACWMTGGGVKFIDGQALAEKGPKHNMGGNVYPSCSPDPGDGGNWTHIAHPPINVKFHGTDITVDRCGNVEGIEPGSESPVTPFNFIEYRGTGWVQGANGNNGTKTPVYFWARVEDRNEPGSEAGGNNAGEDIDRYFLHVFTDPGNPNGTTVLLVDMDGDPSTIDPVTITGGNLQLHISSCDDPPSF